MIEKSEHDDSPLLFDMRDGLAILQLNRPDVHNCVNAEVMDELAARVREIAANEAVRAVVFTAAGRRSFCAGGDLRYFATLDSREAALEMSRRMQSILDRLYFGTKPVIAAVNGQAFGGGCEILTACHFIIAADHVRFAFRQAPNGIITGWGGARRLLVRIGKPQALELLLTGKTIDAPEALRCGLVDQIVPADKLTTAVQDLAQQILGNSRDAVAAFMEISHEFDHICQAGLADLETRRFADLWVRPDFRNFLKAFLQK